MFERDAKRTYSRIPILKTRGAIFRTYLTLPWIPRPQYPTLVDRINELYQWLRTSTGKKQFNAEVYGNFILRDSKTGDLTASYGYRNTSDVQLGSGIKDEADFSLPLEGVHDARHIASNLLNGAATKHFEKIFTHSSRSIVGLAQVVLCVDTFSSGQWLEKFKAARIYEARGERAE